MKKIKFLGLVASLLAFGFMSCDSGVGENDAEKGYAPEIPTTWAELDGSATTSVTAKWTFNTDVSSIGTNEISWETKEIKADSGTGAKLVGGNGFGIKYVAPTGTVSDDMGTSSTDRSTGRIQASNKSASLDAPEKGAMLLLTIDSDTNITVRAKGAGAATSARILVIRKQGETEKLVYKDNLYSAGAKYTPFHLKNAPKGTYEIYWNGSTIVEIDCNSSTTVNEPLPYEANDELQIVLKDKEAQGTAPTDITTYPHWGANADSSSKFDWYKAYTKPDAFEAGFAVQNLYLFDAYNNNVTANATWKIIKGEDLASVSAGVISAKTPNSEGTVTVRARIGRFYQDVDVDLVATKRSAATVFLRANLPAKDTKMTDWTGDAAKKLLTPVVVGQPLVEVQSEPATFAIDDYLNEIKVEKTGTYKVKDGSNNLVYELTENTAETSKGEFWAAKEPSGSNGGIAVKSHKAENSESSDKTLDNNPQDWFSFKFKVKPAAGKTVKITGIRGHLISGAGAGHFQILVKAGDTEIGTLKSFKSVAVPKIDNLTTAYPLTEETEFTCIVQQLKQRKKSTPTSISLDDFGLVVEEAN